ncbi:CpaF family protein [Paraburkholderia sp. J8-2]|uniref:CpaF family protein n=1 Tax=Paraburkholderia sp. J8-2 TaxID=2805440 RepID=UPI002AB7B41E|nr:ATPase, T2SS/T4P/T4SS family [Paraburkholderia sp. J8-2]
MSVKQTALGILKESLRPLQEHFEDVAVTEVMVNPGGSVFIERAGKMIFIEDADLSDGEIRDAITSLGKFVGSWPQPDTKDTFISATIENLRIAGALDPASHGGPSLCIRKHQQSGTRPTLEQLVERNMLTEDQAKVLVSEFVESKRNVMVGGPTGSGKTTLANALCMKIHPFERVISVEDSLELEPNLKHHVRLLTNPNKGVTAALTVQHTLRARPDRLILGETRGHETFDLIRAFNSGHDGSLSTIHASSGEDMLYATEMLFQMSLPADASLSPEAVRGFIGRGIHLCVHVTRTVRQESPNEYVYVRKVNEIIRVKGVKNGEYVLEPLC